MPNDEVIEPEFDERNPSEEEQSVIPLDQIGDVIEKIEKSKQITAIKQIEATDKDNERQFQYARERDQREHSKWNLSFAIGAFTSVALGGFSIYLIVTGEKELGVGLLATVLSGVFGFIAGSGSCKK